MMDHPFVIFETWFAHVEDETAVSSSPANLKGWEELRGRPYDESSWMTWCLALLHNACIVNPDGPLNLAPLERVPLQGHQDIRLQHQKLPKQPRKEHNRF
jgi:hypothetical protein